MLWEVILSPSGIAALISGIFEGLGVPWPGALILAATGTKYTTWQADVIMSTIFSITYTVSSAFQYVLGRYCRHFLDRFLSDATRHKMDRVIQRYGQAAVLWTRPLAIGNYISIPAGMMHMHMGKFLAYTFVGIWPWAFAMVIAGSYLGTYLEVASDIMIWATVGASVLIGIGMLLKRRRRSVAAGRNNSFYN